ncbi:MAG TPA: glycosyltransferase family 4 protein [Terriglobales bacterium]|nr:glycosyltransferase family 4 protein [Terriglobales bacterium]
MRALFAIHTPKDPRTAVYLSTRERAAYLESLGYRCSILSYDDFPLLVRLGPRFNPFLFPLALIWHVLRQQDPYDVVIAHSYAGWLTYALRGFFSRLQPQLRVTSFHGLEPLYHCAFQEESRRAGKPLSLRYRLVQGPFMRRILRLACRRSDLIVCLSPPEETYLCQHSWADAGRVRVIGHGVQEQFFIGHEYRPVAHRLLFVSQWLHMKGTRYLVQAFSRLAGEFPQLTLCCAGTLLPEADVLADFPRDLRHRVAVHPRLEAAELINLYRQADIFVFPSIWEGFGRVRAEAMAAALPVITTSTGAPPGLLKAGQNSILIREQSAEEIVEAVRLLCQNPRLRAELGTNAQNSALALRGWQGAREFARAVDRFVKQPVVNAG